MDAFKIGGFGMWVTLICGVPLIMTSLRYAMTPRRSLVPLMAALAILTLSSGGFGFTTGMIMSLTYLGHVGPDQRYLALIGLGESLYNIAWALLLIVVSAVAASVGAWRLARGESRLPAAA